MPKSIKLNSFGAQTLSNTTDFRQENALDSDAVRDTLYEDVAGAIFDAGGTAAATIVPGEVRCTIKVTGSSTANHKTNTNAISALNGTRATLTGAYADGTTVTCTARCYIDEVTTTSDSFLIPMTVYSLRFRKITNWA